MRKLQHWMLFTLAISSDFKLTARTINVSGGHRGTPRSNSYPHLGTTAPRRVYKASCNSEPAMAIHAPRGRGRRSGAESAAPGAFMARVGRPGGTGTGTEPQLSRILIYAFHLVAAKAMRPAAGRSRRSESASRCSVIGESGKRISLRRVLAIIIESL